ncbi:MAG TPA: hypothetical protein VF254_07205 [Gammaproteobacteria bacterium]
MNNSRPSTWPLLPSHSSYTLHGLTIALADVIREEVSSDISRRALVKANGLATAAELFAGELAHFFGSRMGEYHDAREALQDRYREDALND